MKKSICTTVVLVLTLSGLLSADIYSPVAHWKLDETSGITAYDSAGSNNGTLINNPVWTDGKINGGLKFDGDNDYVNLGNDTSLKLDLPITISTWIELDSINRRQWIIDTDERTTSYCGIWLFVRDDNKLVISYGDGGPFGLPSYRRTKEGTSELLADTWYHIATVIKGPTDMAIYINAVDDGGTYSGSGGSLNYVNGDAFIGASTDHLQYFDGIIDDVRIYNYALSATEIQQLYEIPEPTMLLLFGLGTIMLRRKR